MAEYKRWYDDEPITSLLISLIKSAEADIQIEISEFIINEAKSRDIIFETNIVFEIRRRWYDHDERVYTAIEYLRNASMDARKEISAKAINHLCSISGNIEALKLD